MANQFCGNCGARLDPRTGVCPNCNPQANADRDDLTLQGNDPSTVAPTVDYDGQDGGYSEHFTDNNSEYFTDNYGDNYGNSNPNGYADYEIDYNPPVGYPPPPPPPGDKNNTLAVVLIVIAAVLVLLIAVTVLELTGVIDMFSGIGKPHIITGETTSDRGEPPTVSETETETLSEADDAVEMELTGTVEAETINGSTIYVLKLDSKHEFVTRGDAVTRLGSKVTVEIVQLIGDNAAQYVNHSVRAEGKQRFRNGNAYRYDVILEDVQFTDFGELTTAAPEPEPSTTSFVYSPSNDDNRVDTGTPGTVIPATMSASTYQPNNGERYYRPQEANDNDSQTCWMAYNSERNGAGTWITMNFGSVQRVSGIRLMNGNCWNTDADVFHLNGRVRQFTITADGGRTVETRTANDAKGFQTFYFSSPVETSSLSLYVDSTYLGTKYDTVVCIAELQALY